MSQQLRVQSWIKRNDRQDVNVTAVAYLADGRAVAVRVTNMSYDGCQLECGEALPIGEKLKLAIPRLGEIIAQVRWSLESSAGARFLLEESAPAAAGGMRARV